MRVPSGGCGATICATGGEITRAEDVISIYRNLSANKIQVWRTGGWGSDALLQEQTHPHKDLDIIVLIDDVVRLRELLARAGFCLKELLGLIEDYRQGQVPLIVPLALLKHHLNRYPVLVRASAGVSDHV